MNILLYLFIPVFWLSDWIGKKYVGEQIEEDDE